MEEVPIAVLNRRTYIDLRITNNLINDIKLYVYVSLNSLCSNRSIPVIIGKLGDLLLRCYEGCRI